MRLPVLVTHARWRRGAACGAPRTPRRGAREPRLAASVRRSDVHEAAEQGAGKGRGRAGVSFGGGAASSGLHARALALADATRCSCCSVYNTHARLRCFCFCCAVRARSDRCVHTPCSRAITCDDAHKHMRGMLAPVSPRCQRNKHTSQVQTQRGAPLARRRPRAGWRPARPRGRQLAQTAAQAPHQPVPHHHRQRCPLLRPRPPLRRFRFRFRRRRA
jgi:hypothetical protein